MKNYRVNKRTDTNPNGNNEVHNDSCKHYSQLSSYEYLGQFSNCEAAVTKAKSMGYPKADGCIVCSPTCHNA